MRVTWCACEWVYYLQIRTYDFNICHVENNNFVQMYLIHVIAKAFWVLCIFHSHVSRFVCLIFITRRANIKVNILISVENPMIYLHFTSQSPFVNKLVMFLYRAKKVPKYMYSSTPPSPYASLGAWNKLTYHGSLARRYVKLWVAHAPRMPGTFSPPLGVSDPVLHHGTGVNHVPWCMSGSLTCGLLWSRWWGKRSRHSRRMHNPQFYVSGKRPMPRTLKFTFGHFPI